MKLEDLVDSQKYLNAHEMLSGSNMIWLKDSLTSIGQFNENFGVIGKQLKLGEETDAFEKLWSLNGQAQILFATQFDNLSSCPGV